MGTACSKVPGRSQVSVEDSSPYDVLLLLQFSLSSVTVMPVSALGPRIGPSLLQAVN